MADHLIIAKEVTAGTFVTPSGNMHSGLRSFSPAQGDSRIERRQSGLNRGLVQNRQGIHAPRGDFETLVDPNNFGLLLVGAGFRETAVSTPVGATNARDHGLGFNDTALIKHLSAQIQQTRLAATQTVNIRGMVLDTMSISVQVDGAVLLRCGYIAIEEKSAGGNFADGNASPAAITVSYPTLEREFTFEQLTVNYGATVTWDGTKKIYTFSGGTTLTDLEELTIDIRNNAEGRHTLGSRYPQQNIYGNREVSLSMRVRNDAPSLTWYDKFMAGTQEAWVFTLAGATDAIETGFTNEVEIVIPLLDYTESPFGDLNNEFGARNVAVNGVALMEATGSKDIQFRLRNAVTGAY